MGITTYQEGDYQEVIDAIASGQIHPETMITKKIPMHEVVDEGYKTLINDKNNHVKILIDTTM